MDKIDKKIIVTTVCISIIFIFIIIYLFFASNSNYIPIITAGAGFATIYISLIKYWIDSDSIFKSLFETFNNRFNTLNADLKQIIEKQPTSRPTDFVIQDYLNLCAEEYFWYKKGRIDKEVWYSWVEGINYYLNKSNDIKQYFSNELQYNKSYYGFLAYLKKINKL